MRKGSAHPAARNVRGGMPIKGDRGQRTENVTPHARKI